VKPHVRNREVRALASRGAPAPRGSGGAAPRSKREAAADAAPAAQVVAALRRQAPLWIVVAATGSWLATPAVRAAAEYHGVVDFDNKQIVFTVEKKQSDIF
jgi:pyruvate/2-oxoglutarate dehydrogenase complex dihydrolipoamide acyltransferase (E2) component